MEPPSKSKAHSRDIKSAIGTTCQSSKKKTTQKHIFQIWCSLIRQSHKNNF